MVKGRPYVPNDESVPSKHGKDFYGKRIFNIFYR